VRAQNDNVVFPARAPRQFFPRQEHQIIFSRRLGFMWKIIITIIVFAL
jgi:hypothetical protein